jgi:hypothetical protein
LFFSGEFSRVHRDNCYHFAMRHMKMSYQGPLSQWVPSYPSSMEPCSIFMAGNGTIPFISDMKVFQIRRGRDGFSPV